MIVLAAVNHADLEASYDLLKEYSDSAQSQMFALVNSYKCYLY
jgi:hypothetical protein